MDPVQVLNGREEEEKREGLISRIRSTLQLETPDPILNQMFNFAKLRASESIFATKGGLMHGPGGGSYYAAIWANDQAEYIGPFVPFLGDVDGIEAALNCYRLFRSFMGPDYAPIPSSIIAEGLISGKEAATAVMRLCMLTVLRYLRSLKGMRELPRKFGQRSNGAWNIVGVSLRSKV